MDAFSSVLPDSIFRYLLELSHREQEQLEEIRIRIGRPLEFLIAGMAQFPGRPLYNPTADDGVYLLNKLSNYSLYAFEDELKQGFITLQGGHRVGLAGKVITENGHVKRIRDVSSFNIRIARQQLGVALPLVPFLFQHSTWQNTIIIGPPQTGKTTLIRDLIRIVSQGEKKHQISSRKVGVVDERSEIAGCVKGIPQHDVGPRTDVLDACPKAEGLMMFIRAMSPDVVVADEIGRPADVAALLEAINAGVKLFITVHGASLQELKQRPSLRPLFQSTVFTRFVLLSRERGPGTIKAIYDQSGQDLTRKAGVKLL